MSIWRNIKEFVAEGDAILGSDGKPDRSLFRIDRLHPNAKGYAKWTAVIKPILQADLAQAIPELSR